METVGRRQPATVEVWPHVSRGILFGNPLRFVQVGVDVGVVTTPATADQFAVVGCPRSASGTFTSLFFAQRSVVLANDHLSLRFMPLVRNKHRESLECRRSSPAAPCRTFCSKRRTRRGHRRCSHNGGRTKHAHAIATRFRSAARAFRRASTSRQE